MTIDVIEVPDGAASELVRRVPSVGSGEFNFGSQVIVRESQTAVFFRDGRSLDVLGPGRHTLSTLNLPLVTTRITERVFRESPFKAEVYFVNHNVFAGIKWGTRDPIAYRDHELDLVRLRAHGELALRVTDSALFISKVVGSRGIFTGKDIEGFLKSMIVSTLAQVVGETLTTIFDLAVRYEDLAIATKSRVFDEFASYGTELVSFVIESITPPDEVQARIDERSGIGAIGDLDRYLRYKSALAVEEAAAHPGASGPFDAAIGLGLGMSVLRSAQEGTALAPSNGLVSITCPACRGSAPAGSRFCPRCGTSMADHRCANCQEPLVLGASFCAHCGARVASNQST